MLFPNFIYLLRAMVILPTLLLSTHTVRTAMAQMMHFVVCVRRTARPQQRYFIEIVRDDDDDETLNVCISHGRKEYGTRATKKKKYYMFFLFLVFFVFFFFRLYVYNGKARTNRQTIGAGRYQINNLKT